MYERKIPVACVQLRAHDRNDFTTRWPQITARVEAAAASGAKLVVLPEGTVPAYVLGDAPLAQDELKRASDDLGALARRHAITIVYGSAKILHNRTFNAAIAVGPSGQELGFAAKQFLWHFDRRWFAPGESLEPVDTPVGRLGLLVCADGRIPTIAATLVERGAELLVMPTAWVTSGRDPAALENIQADVMVNVRARENGVPFVAANKTGVELGAVAYCGKSAIVAADGAFVARGGEVAEEIVASDVTLGSPRRGSAATLEIAASDDADAPRPDAKARIAFTLASDEPEVAALARVAAVADANLLVACGPARGASLPLIDLSAAARDTIAAAAGVRAAVVGSAVARNPRGLIAARTAGIDLVIWHVDDAAGEAAAWQVGFARTRAAELRAFVIVVDRAHERAFAVDPDGAVVAGTFAQYRMASFAYDAARAAATLVAPATDVAEGLRIAESIRAERRPATVADGAAR